MGWCQEFAVEIEPACDHLMVAQRRSCKCWHCGAECTGRFAGCHEVWARGPQPVVLRRTKVTPAPQLRSERLALTAGAPALDGGHLPAPRGANAATEDDGELRDVVGMRDFAGMLDALRNEILSLSGKIDRLENRVERADRASPDAETVVEHVDTRLRWLVGELSTRLVIIGNELAALRRETAAERGNGRHYSGNGGPRSPAEPSSVRATGRGFPG